MIKKFLSCLDFNHSRARPKHLWGDKTIFSKFFRRLPELCFGVNTRRCPNFNQIKPEDLFFVFTLFMVVNKTETVGLSKINS